MDRNDGDYARIEKAGGFAFPSELLNPDVGIVASPGMTLRDWFAGQALAQVWATMPAGATYEAVARVSYDIADAMLQARNG